MDGGQPYTYADLPRSHAIPLLKDVVRGAQLYDLCRQELPVPDGLRDAVEAARAGPFSWLFKRRPYGHVRLRSVQEEAVGQPIGEGVSYSCEVPDGPLGALMSLQGMMGSEAEEEQLWCDIRDRIGLELWLQS